MNEYEAGKIIAMVAGIDHRVPPLDRTRPDERVPVWQQVLEPLDYATAEKGVLELARDPGLVAIRPGDIFQATKRVMRRNLDRADIAAIEPPDDIDTNTTLAWRRALVRALGRGAETAAARAEADHAVGARRRTLGPAEPRDVRALIAGTTKETP
ncbi:hypothetical protein [Brachybacterium sp. AOP3-A1-3]|uniref:hypothetical protein n=1 Tax=Brachybacterium sp. AOP3-A1-3 TaxID=3457699 RepID=UPI00403414D6